MTLKRISQIFLALMGIAFCKAGIETMLFPQTVLSNVGIELNNPSALSSMRAVYGGMHFTFGLFCFWGVFKTLTGPLTVVALYTAGFVLGRVISGITDGLPNAFVTTWFATEVFSFATSVLLLTLLERKRERVQELMNP